MDENLKIEYKGVFAMSRFNVPRFHRLLDLLYEVHPEAEIELIKAGYNERSKQITPKQQEIFIKYLG